MSPSPLGPRQAASLIGVVPAARCALPGVLLLGLGGLRDGLGGDQLASNGRRFRRARQQ